MGIHREITNARIAFSAGPATDGAHHRVYLLMLFQGSLVLEGIRALVALEGLLRVSQSLMILEVVIPLETSKTLVALEESLDMGRRLMMFKVTFPLKTSETLIALEQSLTIGR